MNWKKFGKALLFPPLWVVMALAVLSATGLVWVFTGGQVQSLTAIAVYVLSFYSLTVLCLACWKTLPGQIRSFRSRILANPFANRYVTDAVFKARVVLYRSLALNLAYAAANGAFAYFYRTHWFALFALYYGILAVMRFLLIRYVQKNPIGQNRLGELQCARLCAAILLTVNLALSGAVLMMVFFQRGFAYRGYLIYVMALYTFYATAHAITDMIKYRKYHSPVMSVSKMIQLAAALVSMLALETAMLAQFGADTAPETKQALIIATGAGIALFVVVAAVGILIQTTKEIRKLRRSPAYES